MKNETYKVIIIALIIICILSIAIASKEFRLLSSIEKQEEELEEAKYECLEYIKRNTNSDTKDDRVMSSSFYSRNVVDNTIIVLIENLKLQNEENGVYELQSFICALSNLKSNEEKEDRTIIYWRALFYEM